MCLAQKAPGLPVGQIAAAPTHQLGQNHEWRQVGLAATEIADSRADVRRIHTPGEQPARLHHLPTSVVHCRSAMMHGPHERELVSSHGHSG